jgi:hypothetical protein
LVVNDSLLPSGSECFEFAQILIDKVQQGVSVISYRRDFSLKSAKQLLKGRDRHI